METAKTITYSGIFFSCFANDGTKFTQMVKDHTINYVYAGELVLDNNGQKITVHRVHTPTIVSFASTFGSFFPLLITERIFHLKN